MHIPPLTYTVISVIITGLVLGTLIAIASWPTVIEVILLGVFALAVFAVGLGVYRFGRHQR
jgi:hypothetical protein